MDREQPTGRSQQKVGADSCVLVSAGGRCRVSDLCVSVSGWQQTALALAPPSPQTTAAGRLSPAAAASTTTATFLNPLPRTPPLPPPPLTPLCPSASRTKGRMDECEYQTRSPPSEVCPGGGGATQAEEREQRTLTIG